MSRKCTCQICKSKGDTDTFYKITNDKGLNKYYCSKEEFDNFQTKKEKRYNLLKYVAEEVLQLEEGQIVSPSMVKKISKLNEFYDFEVIHESFMVNLDTIHYWIKNKNFSNEYGMVSYIMKIIEGSINDIYNKWKHKKKTLIKQENHSVDLGVLNGIGSSNSIVKKDSRSILEFLDKEDV